MRARIPACHSPAWPNAIAWSNRPGGSPRPSPSPRACGRAHTEAAIRKLGVKRVLFHIIRPDWYCDLLQPNTGMAKLKGRENPDSVPACLWPGVPEFFQMRCEGSHVDS